MSDLSVNNRCPDCRRVLTSNGRCARCKIQVKPRTKGLGYTRGYQERSNLGKIHSEAFYKEFDRVFKLTETKLSLYAMEWWEHHLKIING
jgi:hypothetical protein